MAGKGGISGILGCDSVWWIRGNASLCIGISGGGLSLPHTAGGMEVEGNNIQGASTYSFTQRKMGQGGRKERKRGRRCSGKVRFVSTRGRGEVR